MSTPDPVDVAVIAARLASICREMGETMLRTSRSPIFSEARDFTTAVFDAGPRLLAQTIYIPNIAASTPFAARAVASRFGARARRGDLYVLNDPFRGNNHPPDLNVLAPVFAGDVLAFWVLAKGHQADIGGGGVVGYNPGARDAWEDALRIPCLQIAEAGVLREDVVDFILLNVRARDLVDGDLRCQIGAVNLGVRRLEALLASQGMATLAAAVDAILDATERRVRASITAIPDGEYRALRAIDHDGVDRSRSPVVRLALRVTGDAVTFDYTGSDAQVAGYLNSTMPNTTALSQLALFATHAIAKDIPFNEGAVRPLTVIAPEGSLLNAREPAATSACTLCTGEAIVEAVWLALAQVLPEAVPALWARWCAPATAGINPRTGRFFADIHFMSKGGGGALHGHDGWDHIGTPVTLGGLRAPDPELHELVAPYRLLEYEYLQDSAGAGEWRGGLGVRYAWEVLADGIACANFGSGVREATAPCGLAGGAGAAPHELWLDHADGTREAVDGNSFYRLARGDRFHIHASGGGGYGDPHRRPAARVLADVRDGVVSPEVARAQYGVAVRTEGAAIDWTVDEAQTAALRGARRQ